MLVIVFEFIAENAAACGIPAIMACTMGAVHFGLEAKPSRFTILRRVQIALRANDGGM